jgi:hypothetical protein
MTLGLWLLLGLAAYGLLAARRRPAPPVTL